MSSVNGVKPPALQIEGLWTGYNRQPVLEDVSFQVAVGDIVGVIGPNGSGKSTLLKCILGLVKPWRGQILVLGRPSSEQRRLLGYMPQVERVDWDFPVTVGDVALMGRAARRGLLRRTTAEDREAASHALEQVGMFPLRQRLIGELSGGQRRRALLARALASNPAVVLLDEPMAGLDATSQHHLLDIIGELSAHGATVILSTHDLSCVSSRCRHAACLNRRLVAFGKPEDVLNEQVLNETFGTHLLLVHGDGQAYAYRHHSHESDQPASPVPAGGKERTR
ncbi:MAG: metal ABC transporter ATP-binding protein [SAR202 cluster bacterium]|nr:metal ABC transporter ATP-binding protein [SAR202 cluster bacterium]